VFTDTGNRVRITVRRAAMAAIYAECDRYDVNETGGRLLGVYDQVGRQLVIEVHGVIEPGPGARRTPTSFFQDGEYQERVFRLVESRHPGIEHLGNWHTHHVNGLDCLSTGDIKTYRRNVNHQNHNPDLFVAFLVTRRLPKPQRYAMKFYVLLRGNDKVFEVPATAVSMVDVAPVWPR